MPEDGARDSLTSGSGEGVPSLGIPCFAGAVPGLR